MNKDIILKSNENNTNPFEDVLSGLVNQIAKYDVFDFIARIAGLNILSLNQNKTILTDTLMQNILSHPYDDYCSSFKMSDKKFSSIIDELNNTSLAFSIDPCENTVVQNIMFAGNNYRVFNGIDYTPAYNMQSLIRVLFFYHNSFAFDYLEKVHILFTLLLTISEEIACKSNIDLSTAKYSEEKKVIIPPGKAVRENAEYIKIPLSRIEKLIAGKFPTEELLTEFAESNTGDINNRPFYIKPFLKDSKSNNIIVLNVTLLPAFAFYKAIEWAEQFKVKDELLRKYNDYLWLESKKALTSLGHHKINEKAYSLDCLSNDYYKEAIFTVYNNQLLFVFYMCDDGADYSKGQIHTNYPDNRHSSLFNDRLIGFKDKLKKLGAKKEDTYFLIVLSSFGRSISVGIDYLPFGYKPISLNPFELHCVEINEREETAFLPRYIRAKSLLNTMMTGIFSELNTICIYTSNHNSFYISDDIDLNETQVFFPSGDSIEYITCALEKENRSLIDAYDGNKTEVILFDKTRNIFIEDQLFNPMYLALCIIYDNVIFWIKTEEFTEYEQIDPLYSLVDCISYWLSECKDIIERFVFPYAVYTLNISLKGDLTTYYYEKKETIPFADCIDYSIVQNHISILFSPEAFRNLNQNNNEQERKLCQFILGIFDNISLENQDYTICLNSVFNNPLKKKFYSFDYENKPYYKPIKNENHRLVKKEDEDYISDLLGKELLKSGEWQIGVVKDSQKNKTTNTVVAWLYDQLISKINDYSPDNMLEAIYQDLEETLYNLMILEKRYYSDILCYPEKEELFLETYNNLNKTSLALKFLIEYVTARPSSGVKPFGIGQYEELLAFCSLIIDWAYKGDLFRFGIVNTPIEFLRSKRIGMKHDEFIDMYQYSNTYRNRQLKYDSSYSIRKTYSLNNQDFNEDLENAFTCEFGYSYSEFIQVIATMITLNQGEIITITRTDAIKELLSLNSCLKERLINNVLDNITYCQRKDYLKLPDGYNKEDAYPWRFNRQYSFNRRPVLQRGNSLIWGNRQLYHMTEYITDLIYIGKFKSKSEEMKSLCGKISKNRGACFNELIYEMLKDMNTFSVFANVKKINGKRIAESGKDLGDIDILIIDSITKKIIVTEVKNFRFSRNPHEIKQEYEKMFKDKEKPCFATKHKKRTQWVKDHINDVILGYKLEDSDWTVTSLFIVNQPLISQHIYNEQIKCISKAELSIDAIREV